MHKADLLEQIRTGRERWETLLAGIEQARMTEPGVEGSWRIKDIVAHVTHYEQEIVTHLEAALARQLPPPQLDDPTLDLDERNAQIYARHQAQPLAEVLAESRRVFEALTAVVEALSETDLADPDRLGPFLDPAWTEGAPLAECIASDTYEHYEEHISTIKTWLEQREAA